MKKLVALFIRYPFYANLIISIVLMGGIYGIATLKKSFFPERRSREIYVNVFYPGASPKEMEEGITVRIEEAVRGLVGIKEINSTSSENMTRVEITTTGEYDIDVIVQEVKNAVDGISAFPSAAERPIVYKRRNTTPAVRLGLASEGVDLLTLKKFAMEIEDDFRATGLITQINVFGYPELEISVEISEQNRLRYGVSFDEISQAIRMNNSDISAGQIKSDDEEILIRSRKRSVDPDQIGNIIVRANADGSFVRVRDIATVEMKFADVASKSMLNGEIATGFFIQKLVDEDLQKISDYVNKYVDAFNEQHEGMHLYVTFDFLSMLRARLNLLLRNGGIGILLVLITLGLFLSLRLSFWVAFGIPFSFLGMFLAASSYGITINMISLFGMILVVGILVDDGIVIAENIYSHFEKGKPPRKAALDGSLEVLPAVLTSVTTTMVAFAPLLIIKEGGMEFMAEMAFVVIISLLFSLIEAFLVLPGHLGHAYILRSKDAVSTSMNIRRTLDKFIFYMREKIYGRLLRWIIRWRWYVAGVMPLVLFLLTFAALNGGIIKYTFFPAIPFDFFTIDVAFTPGSGEKQTWEYIMRFDSVVWEVNKEIMDEHAGFYEKNPEEDQVIRFSYPSLGSAFSGVENGSHAGSIFVQPRDLDKLGIPSFEVAQRIRQKIGTVPEAEKFQVGGINRWGKPVSISLLGKDFEELEQAEAFLIKGMQELDELDNVVKTNAAGKREIQLKLKPKAYFLGLDHTGISNQVRQGFFGGQAQRLQEGKDEIRVWVRYPKSDRKTIGQMETMRIMTPGGGEYPLSELATYEIKRGPVNINRYNMQREVRVESDLTDPYAPVPPILEKLENTILKELKAHYPGIRIEYQGQQRRSSESMGELLKWYTIALIIIIILVMLHFRSISQSFIIILMIPLSWVGAAWGHSIEGLPVSMLSAWGMVALSGVIINDAVVFLSKYNINLQSGMKLKEAVYEAGLSRFRPILLTTITTSVGLYPIILERSFQAQFLKPMAVALAYGVFIGTAFILIFFPALIVFLNDIRVARRWMWTGAKPTREEVEIAVRHLDIEKEIQK